MAKEERKLVVYICDNPPCLKAIRHDPEVDGQEEPPGFHGTVRRVHENGGSPEDVYWFAHHTACVRGAVLAMADSSDQDGYEEPQEDSSSPEDDLEADRNSIAYAAKS